MPEPVVLPPTIFEKQLSEKSVEVRDAVIDEINSRTGAELASPAGKEAFKEALIKRIGELIDAHYGKVTEVYLPDIVSS
jgi:flagellar basal body-associated protein FliL